MFKPDMPVVPGTTVVNNQILDFEKTYHDLSMLDSTYRCSLVKNISVYSLDKCIRTILEANPDVVFNTIAYSESDHIVYFFTDKNINKQPWRSFRESWTYSKITDNKEILEEISRVLKDEGNDDPDYISLYDVEKHIRKIKAITEKIKQKYREIIESNFYLPVRIKDFDSKKNRLDIIIDNYPFQKNVSFSKKDGDLFIVGEESSLKGRELLEECGTIISMLFDELSLCPVFSSCDVSLANSNFAARIDSSGVTIYSDYISELDFKMVYNSSQCYCTCNSLSVLNAFSNSKTDILKKILVRIDRLPSEIVEPIYRIRQDQLEKDKKEKDKTENNKTLRFLSSIFSYIRKGE